MDLDKQLRLGHLLLNERKCSVCEVIKDLTDEFYRSRKDKGPVASSYSYECKECTKKRISKNRKNKSFLFKYEYPDW